MEVKKYNDFEFDLKSNISGRGDREDVGCESPDCRQRNHHPEWERSGVILAQTRLEGDMSDWPDLFRLGMVGVEQDIELIEIAVDRRKNGIGTGYKHESTYIDGDLGLFFDFSNGARLLLGFCLHESRGELEIAQIQKINKARNGLKGRWERVLVKYGIYAAEVLGQNLVTIRPAEENGYVIAGRYPYERASLRYDVTAKRMGFKFDPERKRYVMPVGQEQE